MSMQPMNIIAEDTNPDDVTRKNMETQRILDSSTSRLDKMGKSMSMAN